MPKPTDLFEPFSVPCTCKWHEEEVAEDHCVCGPVERVLRFVIAVEGQLSADQREYCLSEIETFEGHRRSDHETASDADLVQATINAWTDYCRDKGLM